MNPKDIFMLFILALLILFIINIQQNSLNVPPLKPELDDKTMS